MLTMEQAEEFAQEWIAAWNSHDLDRILSHYTDDFEMSSPVIAQVMAEPSGRLQGKERISVYWGRALERYPGLYFEKLHVLRGVDSVTIIYNGVRGLSAEVFHFNVAGKVSAAYAHYLSV